TAFEVGQGPDMDLLVFSDAMDRLGELDPRQRQIVELKLFYGFEHQEIAELLGGISATTSKREWRAAKLWLLRELSRK
ncbi:MAG TPA: ECF-type sigma factor, partial [Thermoanaerobaculia bacterium]